MDRRTDEDRLSPEDLATLRRAVGRVADDDSNRMPLAKLVASLGAMTQFGPVTVDLGGRPGEDLPIIVLRPPGPIPSATFDCLSRRELSVVELVAQGRTNRQIAELLYLSLATVKDHVHNILAKTGLQNRAGMTASFLGRRSSQVDSDGK